MAIITCPSGLQGEIRGMRGKEAALLTDKHASRDGSVIEKILRSCWVKTIDPGPYAFDPEKPLDWMDALVGDRLYTLIQIRIETFGPEYSFMAQCQKPTCRHRFEQPLDLSQLPQRKLSEEAALAFQNGNRFESRFSRDGRRVWFRLLTGRDELEAKTKITKSNVDPMLASLLFRIQEIEDLPVSKESAKFGVTSVNPADKGAQRRFLEDLPFGDMVDLLNQFGEVDCGVDTGVTIECPECWEQEEIDLPFDRQFFLPRPSKRSPQATSTF